MAAHRLLLSHIRSLKRPNRPPRQSAQPPQPRPFTHNTQLLLLSPHSQRPHLPFLHPTSGLTAQSASRIQFGIQSWRSLTTERKQRILYEVKTGLKWAAFFWIGAGLLGIMYFGIQQEYLERNYPSPSEWSLLSRISYRRACAREDPDPSGTRMVDTVNTGGLFRGVMQRLEDPTKDGAGLLPILQEDGDIYVEGLGKTGFDITAKSEPWRRGYFDSIMGAARGAEANEGKVLDKTRNIAFPPENVVGPSNPRPKPVPFGSARAPKEEDCVPLFEAPETFYMKILTSRGFDTRQRLQAALAYADWLDFRGLSSTAEDMYDWGLDIAMGALPEGFNNVVDTKTGIINAQTEYMSSNILTATTALATHHARNNNLATALPIFLSVLRARRQLPLSDSLTSPPSPAPNTQDNSILASIKSLLTSPPFPPPPPSGNNEPQRTPLSICEEAGLMAHIGEILFASSSTPTVPQSSKDTPRASGLGWTRDAIELAETTLASVGEKEGAEEDEARKKCRQCVQTGMENWRLMVLRMVREKRRRDEGPVQAVKRKGGWLWGGGGDGDGSKEGGVREDEGRWAGELQMVEGRLKEMRAKAAKDEERAQISMKKVLRDLFV